MTLASMPPVGHDQDAKYRSVARCASRTCDGCQLASSVHRQRPLTRSRFHRCSMIAFEMPRNDTYLPAAVLQLRPFVRCLRRTRVPLT